MAGISGDLTKIVSGMRKSLVVHDGIHELSSIGLCDISSMFYIVEQGSQTHGPWATCGPQRRYLRPATHYL